MARRFEDDALVMVFEANMDEWLKEVQFRSGQKILLVIFVARGMTINLEGCGDWFLIGFLIGDMVKYVYVANVLRDGIVLRCNLVCLMKTVFSKNCRMGLAVKRRNCGNLLNVLQNREVGGGFGLFGGRKVACCEIKKVQCQSVCREVCPDNPCLDENTLRAKHPYVMHISLWRGDRASAKSRKEVHGTVWCSGGF